MLQTPITSIHVPVSKYLDTNKQTTSTPSQVLVIHLSGILSTKTLVLQFLGSIKKTTTVKVPATPWRLLTYSILYVRIICTPYMKMYNIVKVQSYFQYVTLWVKYLQLQSTAHSNCMYTSRTPHKQADRTGTDTTSYVGVHICTEIRQCLPRVLDINMADTAACSPWLRHTHSG